MVGCPLCPLLLVTPCWPSPYQPSFAIVCGMVAVIVAPVSPSLIVLSSLLLAPTISHVCNHLQWQEQVLGWCHHSLVLICAPCPCPCFIVVPCLPHPCCCCLVLVLVDLSLSSPSSWPPGLSLSTHDPASRAHRGVGAGSSVVIVGPWCLFLLS